MQSIRQKVALNLSYTDLTRIKQASKQVWRSKPKESE
jgi:hypothetical protein